MDPYPLPLLCRLVLDGADPGTDPQLVALAALDADTAASTGDVVIPTPGPCAVTAVTLSSGPRLLWTIPTRQPVEVPADTDVLIPAGALRVPLAELPR